MHLSTNRIKFKHEIKGELLFLGTLILVPIVLTLGIWALFIPSGSSELDIQMHDVYFVVSVSSIFPPISLLTLFFGCLGRTIVHRFCNVAQNLLLGLVAFLLLLVACGLQAHLGLFWSTFSGMRQGWTVYPPLSALPMEDESVSQFELPPLSLVLLAFQVLLVGLMLLLGYCTGLQVAKRSTIERQEGA